MSVRLDRLATAIVGEGSRTVVFVHGFTQTKKSWTPLLDELAPRMPNTRYLLVDLPGHGDSAAISASLRDTAELLVEVGGHATYVGYSLGARVVLHAALAHPELMQSCVLISGTPGIEDDDERARRRANDEQLADRIITIGTRTFIDEWLTQPLFSSLTREQAGRDERLVNTPEGLANSLRTSGTGTQDNLWPRLGEVSTRTLLVVGERDQKFLEIARRMSNALPNAPLSVISSAGHSAHLEQPAKVAVDLARFLNREVA